MNDLRQAAEMALKVLEEINEISKPPAGIPLPAEIDNSMETLRQALSKPKCEWVGLTDEEVQDAGRYSYCRGGTSESLYRIMWNSQPSASVGWCREELIAFAQTIESRIRDKNR